VIKLEFKEWLEAKTMNYHMKHPNHGGARRARPKSPVSPISHLIVRKFPAKFAL